MNILVLQKSRSHKYIRRYPKPSNKGWNYIYKETFLKPFKALAEIFGVTKTKIDNLYSTNNIQKDYGVDKDTFAAHILKYMSKKEYYDEKFSNPTISKKYKKPVKEGEKKQTEKKEKKPSEQKKWNTSLIRKIWSIYNPEKAKAVEGDTVTENKPIEFNVGDTILYNNKTGKVTSVVNDKMVMVKYDNGGMARLFKEDLEKVNATSEEIAEEVVEELNTEKEIIAEDSGEHGNETAMLGNDNAKKDVIDETLENDKAEYKMLVSRINELEKEFKANGGWSNRRTTSEQDIKRREARKELEEVKRKLNDFRERIAEKNKGVFKISEVYKDNVNEWLKRKMKGQTVSTDWLEKKFGGYGTDDLSFGDDYSLSLASTEDVNSPAVRIYYQDYYGRNAFVLVEVGKFDDEDYRPRYMPQESDKFTEVYKKLNTLKEQVKNTTGNTPAEKFYNAVLGINNEFTNTSKDANLPRFRFTKDGIKNKNGTLEKISASVRNPGEADEVIVLYADSYGSSIPSIFYPENNSDTQTDYFEKDSAVIEPDHPYYNHLKLMALKRSLYRAKATKWAIMTKEQQDAIEKEIKEIESRLIEPTEETLTEYRKKRDVLEEEKKKEKEAKIAEYHKKMEERKRQQEQKELDAYNKLISLLQRNPNVESLVPTETGTKYDFEGKTFTITGLNNNNAPIMVSSDGEKIEFDDMNEFNSYYERGEITSPSNTEETTESTFEKYKNRSDAMMGNENAKKDFVEETVNIKDELNTPIPQIDKKTVERINDISMTGHSGEIYQKDINTEMDNFKNMFDYEKMNTQQKEYFRERLNSFSSLVGSSYTDMANKRLAAGPSWIVAGPAKYNTKRFQQKMDAEMRVYDDFKGKKEKFIKNTQKRLKELKYSGGSESIEDVKQRVFEDYARGNYAYGEKIDNTDPYAIEKMKGKIKYMEDVHAVTLLFGKICKKYGISTVVWTDKTDEDRAKRKEVLSQTRAEAEKKGYPNKAIKEGIDSPFTQTQTAEIRRNKQRLEEMEKRQAVIESKKDATESASLNSGKVDFDGGYIFENLEMDRIQIIYNGKPSRDVIDKLKHNGFRWSPSQGAWQRQLNRNGRMAVNRVMKETGINTEIDIDGAGEIKKSQPDFIIKNGRFYIKNW